MDNLHSSDWTLVGVLFAIGASLAAIFSHTWNFWAGVFGFKNGKHDVLKRDVESRLDAMSLKISHAHDRITQNHTEFLRFQTEVAKELATKEDLDKTEARLSKRIDESTADIIARLSASRR